MGDRPFSYEVELVLDGVHYVATAEWPADVIAGNEPSVALEFDPDLPRPLVTAGAHSTWTTEPRKPSA